jgi:hypothetical protein
MLGFYDEQAGADKEIGWTTEAELLCEMRCCPASLS